MTVAVIPSTGVSWSLPSRRGRSYWPDAAASAIRAWRPSFDRVRRRSRSTLTIRNVVVSVWAGSTSPAVSNPNPANAHRSASPEASMKAVARTRARPARVATTIDSTRPSRTSAAWTIAWSRMRDAGLGREPLPGDLEVLGEVGHAGPGAVRVRPLQHRTQLAQGGDDVIADATDDLAGLRARRVEAVERVEDGRARAPEEGQAIDEQHGRAGPRGRDGRARTSRAGADHADVHVRDERPVAGHAGGSAVVEISDQPPSTASDWPVTARDSSERK